MCPQALPHGLLVPGLHKCRQPICEHCLCQASVLLSPSLPLLAVYNASRP